MAQGLAVSDVVNVGIVLSPTAVAGRDFGTLLIVGNSPVIDTSERMRTYTNLTGVAQDFGTTAPEYQAAQTYFAQSPQPYRLLIGRWAQTSTSGVLRGAILGATVQATRLAALQAVTAGTLTVTIDGTARALTSLNFSATANLYGAAGVIDTALGSYGDCTFNGDQFVISSKSAGPASTVGYATSPSGVDISALTSLSQAAGALPPVPGMAAESAIAAVQTLAGQTSDWYALTFALATPISDAIALQVAATIEGLNPVRVFGLTTQSSAVISTDYSIAAASAVSGPDTATGPDGNVLTSTDGTTLTVPGLGPVDIGAALHLAGYSRSVVQYSSTNPYAVCSFFGRALSVNYNAVNSVITMKFKQEPGVIPELLSETAAARLNAKGVNAFVAYQNGAAIVQQGTVSNGRFFDEVFGIDWLANAIQNDLWNLLYQATSKVPQTDDGVHLLLVQVEATLSRAVTNGLLAPGIWNAEGFGQLKRGDPLPKAYYVFAPLVATQSQADREARKAPVIQAAVKLAGAVHSVDVQLNINR